MHWSQGLTVIKNSANIGCSIQMTEEMLPKCCHKNVGPVLFRILIFGIRCLPGGRTPFQMLLEDCRPIFARVFAVQEEKPTIRKKQYVLNEKKKKYIYIYIYIYVCVCVCVAKSQSTVV